ncbi:MAG: 23S rRNA (adenine(2503)-C(2))-methyltransferase RlmN [Porphyromonadaceae bacterium]|jgi:23S rRNA (adenine2503-C2)-methyltransferase|nr:23S rRNA (adenine(2503)-C(2))-methyltransferase RlmN [Porphyromonadaceae bacterium]
MTTKQNLYGLTLNQLKEVVNELGLPKFTASQIADWLYRKHVVSIDEMTNLSIKARQLLDEKYFVGLIAPSQVQASKDGTKKYLYPTSQAGKFIEAAYIPDKNRGTLCVSSQIGCKMGCLFCMTGKQGFQGNLTAGEIVNQIQSLPEFEKLTNIVYMGMGEPLDNVDAVLNSLEILTAPWGYGWSPKRITVSTIGIIPAMLTFLEKSKAHLAVSLHTPFDEERRNLMPIQNVYPISKVISEIKKWDMGKQRRVSFEYIMFKGVNDTPKHVKEMVRLLSGIRCRINLIRFHPIPDTVLEGTPDEDIIAFQNALKARGMTVTIRASRGEDIFAACGMLSTKALVKKSEELDY